MIAEDDVEAREILIYELNEHYPAYNFEIEECESPLKVFSKLSDSSKQNKYFDVAFVDIDFTIANTKGGRRDSGFEIIEKAFQTCPFTKVCTYSGQFRAFDLSDKFHEIERKGLVSYPFDKSHQGVGEKSWFVRGFQKVLVDVERDLIVWDIWENSLKLIDRIKSTSIDQNQFKNAQQQLEIINLIESVYPLIKNSIENNDGTSIDEIIKKYHNILEIFCRSGKNPTQIISDSDNNKSILEKKICGSLKYRDGVNALRIIAGHSNTDYFRCGYKLNGYRNHTIHPETNFIADIANLLFSHLAVCLYILGKETAYSYIKQFSLLPQNSCYSGLQDLKDIIVFIEGL